MSELYLREENPSLVCCQTMVGWSTGPKVQTLSLRSESKLKWTTTTTNMVENLYFLKGGGRFGKRPNICNFSFLCCWHGAKSFKFLLGASPRGLVAPHSQLFALSLFSPRGVVSSPTIKSWIPFVDSHMLFKWIPCLVYLSTVITWVVYTFEMLRLGYEKE